MAVLAWQFVITLIEEDFATQMFFFVFKPSLNWDTVSHIVWKLDNQYHKTIVLNNMTVIQYWGYYLVFDSEWVSSYITLTSYSYPFFFRHFISTRMFFCITWCTSWDMKTFFVELTNCLLYRVFLVYVFSVKKLFGLHVFCSLVNRWA